MGPTYKITMAIKVSFDFDPQDHPECFDLEEKHLDPYDKKDIHKFIQDQWKDIGIIDDYTGEWELNELKVEDVKGS